MKIEEDSQEFGHRSLLCVYLSLSRVFGSLLLVFKSFVKSEEYYKEFGHRSLLCVCRSLLCVYGSLLRV